MTDDLVKRVADLEALVYAPGRWKCAKCNFVLIQANLNANDGTVTARDNPGDKCPNCDSPLWRVSWKQEAEENLTTAERFFEEKKALEAALATAHNDAVEKAAEEVRGQLKFYEEQFKSSMPPHLEDEYNHKIHACENMRAAILSLKQEVRGLVQCVAWQVEFGDGRTTWIAATLDHDIMAQGATFDEAKRRLQVVLEIDNQGRETKSNPICKAFTVSPKASA